MQIKYSRRKLTRIIGYNAVSILKSLATKRNIIGFPWLKHKIKSKQDKEF